MIDPLHIEFGIGDNPPKATLYYGQNVLDTLKSLPDCSVQLVATSPPYWGLRDYGGEPPVWGGDEDCGHDFNDKGFCTKCDAWKGPLGLEPTPQLYVDHLVLIFREARRVLREDGVLFVNLGDSYFGSCVSGTNHKNLGRNMVEDGRWPVDKAAGGNNPNHKSIAGPAARKDPEAYWHLKVKDLVGIPWMVAFALRTDGWYLRQDIIWAKNSCMPESVRDRCTKSHEYIFMLTKSHNYFYDQDAIREPHKEASLARYEYGLKLTVDDKAIKGSLHDRVNAGLGNSERMGDFMNPTGRNRRSVWTINPKPYPGAHFAVWPEELVEVMVLAGTSQHGACAGCGAPYQRVVERKVPVDEGRSEDSQYVQGKDAVLGRAHDAHRKLGQAYQDQLNANPRVTTGWEPTCSCEDAGVRPCVVLDPFSGSATTGAVAMRLGRNYIGCDLQPDYLPLAQARLEGRKAPKKDGDDEPNLIDDLFGA